MKKIYTGALLLMFLFATATSSFAQKSSAYGQKFDHKHALNTSELKEKMGDKKEMNVVVSGEISEVCQAEGCWMKLKDAKDGDIFVKFKDHAFVIPKDLAGHHTFVKGTLKVKEISVEEQRHYATDAGKSADEVAAITEPTTEMHIDATGVVIE